MSNIILPGGTDDGYQISRSVRLRSSASAFFSRTPASAGNRKTWTWSGWVKRGALGGTQTLLAAGLISGTFNYTRLFFDTSDRLVFAHYPDALSGWLTTAQVFRDPSAWYHIDAIFDSTAATASDRMRLFVNGVQITAFTSGSFATTYPALNTDSFLNTTSFASNIGRNVNGGTAETLDGYLTEINFIDGQALTPSAFGETDAVTGVWKPKKYTGTYGTNGFYLNFADNSAATATAIGKDSSGQGNNWTPNNVSLTLGATYDSMLDVPTNWADGGNGRGNYCVVSPITNSASGNITPSNANLSLTIGLSGQWRTAVGTIAIPPGSGSWYWEVTPTNTASGADMQVGIIADSVNFVGNFYPGQPSLGFAYQGNGQRVSNATNVAYGATYTQNDVIGVAYNSNTGELTFYKNGVSQGTAYTVNTANFYYPVFGGATTIPAYAINFGQRPFAYTPPTGFRALNTQNLPEPLISNGRRWMDVLLHTGGASASQTLTGLQFQPDLAWFKSRSSALNHALFDSVRGANQWLGSNLTNAETTWSGQSFQPTGFTVDRTASSETNSNGVTYADWFWRRGAQAGFDIVTFSPNGTGTTTVNHSLGVAPAMIITKQRSVAGSWTTYHQAIGAGSAIYLNLTNAAAAGATIWNNTAPTSTQFTLGSAFAGAGTMVAYLFAEVPGFSRFGSYTGNGSADGPFVFCGFRPRWVMVKRTDTTANWRILDTARDTFNAEQFELYPNLSNAEGTFTSLDGLSNGFKIRNTDVAYNSSGGTYIFAAFAENPFKHSLAR